MKHWCRHILLVLVALPFLALGCRGNQDQPIFEDTFDLPDGVWGDDARGEFSRGYESGTYFFQLVRPNWFAWTTQGKELADARYEIESHLSSGPKGNHSGIICRLKDAGNFYYLAVSSDGYYGIFRRVDEGPLEAINAARAMVYSPAILTGNQVNQIEAICDGDALSLSANGQMLETVVDGTLRKGRYGFGAGSSPDGVVRIQFDNLAVYAR